MLSPETITPCINDEIDNDNKFINEKEFTLNHNNNQLFKVTVSLNENKKFIGITCQSADLFPLIEYQKSLFLDELINKTKQFYSFHNIKEVFNLIIELFEKNKVFIKQYKEKEMIKIEIKLSSLIGDEQSFDIALYKKEITKDNLINQLIQKVISLEKDVKKLKEDNMKRDKEIEFLKNSLDEITKKQNDFNKKEIFIEKKEIKDIHHFGERNPSVKIKNPEIHYNNFMNSRIIDEKKLDFVLSELKAIYNIQDNSKKLRAHLLYRASIDGFESNIFHNKCDNIEGTLIFVENNRGMQFGGFTMATWDGIYIAKKDDNAFCFSISLRKIYKIIKNRDAIRCDPNYGPVFLNDIFGFRNKILKKGKSLQMEYCNYMGSLKNFEINGWEQNIDAEEIEVYMIYVE